MMGGVVFMAISRKSEYKVRLAALGALALMIVTVIVCFILYFKAAGTPQQLILPDMLPSEMPPPPPANSPVTMIMLIVFMIVLFAVTFILAMREHKRTEGKEEPPSNDW